MSKWTKLTEISELTQVDTGELMYLAGTTIPSNYVEYHDGQVLICEKGTAAIISAANIAADTERTMLDALSVIMAVETKRRESEKQAG